ncbi:MAG TPA: helix-turn-helix transcriptional regulator [Mycobacterium sp.]|nr:helix-turn-helix transcriptional regulator [Mycobacterium sp.]
MPAVSQPSRYVGGIPVHRFPGGPANPVAVQRIQEGDATGWSRLHIHDFPVLWYMPASGVVHVVAAGTPIDPDRIRAAEVFDGVGVLFDPAAIGEDARSPWPAWRGHPLLFPFLHNRSGGLLELTVPPERRPFWEMAIASIEREMNDRRAACQQAALAHLTLLLIDLARIADDVVGDLRRSGEPLLAEVFSVIERRGSEALSLRDVADEVGLTPGHLTTVVRQRTGRTVQDWIIEDRMTRARSLLADPDLSIGAIAIRLGMADQAYFSRLFRRHHGVSPREWRVLQTH